ncbi:MAG: hypothetical protein Q4Q07_01525 [Tissierellia bacterium]|nr:hypothetical protein [Tissierellia bacterium]
MKKEIKVKIVYGLFSIIMVLGIISGIKDKSRIEKGGIQYENLSIFTNNVMEYSENQKVKIGLGHEPKEYQLQWLEKKENKSLVILEEKNLILPADYAYVTLEDHGDNVRIQIFSKDKKIYSKIYLLTMFPKNEESWEDKSGNQWVKYTFLTDKRDDIFLLYGWSIDVFSKNEHKTIFYEGIQNLLQDDFKGANQNLKAGNYILLKEKIS